ncbi:WD40 repeat domain-containing protein [Candidatus Dependentiae bacterium]|nr:WD40 repeat domain-containing protein [Candidatus Dependentiae bacterium]
MAQNSKHVVPAFGNSLLKNKPLDYFTIECSDKKLAIPLTFKNDRRIKRLKKQSGVIQCMISDGIAADKELSLPSISSLELSIIFALLLRIDHRIEFEGKLNDLSKMDLSSVVKNANALNIPILFEKASIALAAKIDKKIESIGSLSDLEVALGKWNALELPYDVDEKIVPHLNLIYPQRQITAWKNLKGHTDGVRDVALSADGKICAALSADGKICASASDDKTVRIWNTETESSIATFAHNDYVKGVALSADGKTCASASDDKTVRIWNTETQAQITVLDWHTDRVRRVALSADGKTCASVSDDMTVRIWNKTPKAYVPTFVGVKDVQLSANGKICVSVIDNQLGIWKTETEKAVGFFDAHYNCVRALALTADGKICASASDDGTVRIWNLQSLLETPRIAVDQAMLLSFLLKHSQKNKLIDLKNYSKLDDLFKSLPEDIKKKLE